MAAEGAFATRARLPRSRAGGAGRSRPREQREPTTDPRPQRSGADARLRTTRRTRCEPSRRCRRLRTAWALPRAFRPDPRAARTGRRRVEPPLGRVAERPRHVPTRPPPLPARGWRLVAVQAEDDRRASSSAADAAVLRGDPTSPGKRKARPPMLEAGPPLCASVWSRGPRFSRDRSVPGAAGVGRSRRAGAAGARGSRPLTPYGAGRRRAARNDGRARRRRAARRESPARTRGSRGHRRSRARASNPRA